MLVVGAGPAGADLARRLALAGIDVLLVDQLPDLAQAAFSSAAMPLAALERFGLPAQVVASRWSRWELIGPGPGSRHWQAPSPMGVVLDFGALRGWLADQCQRWNGRVRLGLRAVSSQRDPDGTMSTELRDRGGRRLQVRSPWVVDASGQGRALLGEPPLSLAAELVRGVGVEWLLEVPAACWQRWADRLAFCLGTDWVPQGYGWLFPMQPGRLKVGVCRLEDPGAGQPEAGASQPPLGTVLQRLLGRLLPAGEAGFQVLDRHGGLIRSTIGRREPHRRGRLIGLGDAVSTANLLGGEGIRHALTSSAVLAPLLLQALASGDNPAPLQAYEDQLRRALGWCWPLSGRLARRTWLGLRGPAADRRLERLLNGLQQNRAEDLSALLFDYRFERYGLRALPYLLGWR